jgi:outer membrane protein assembly factor BamB
MDGSDLARAVWPEEAHTRPLQLFLSYAAAEREIANTIATHLHQRGFAIESTPSGAATSALPRLIETRMLPDSVVVILSPDALWSPVVAEEMRLAAELLRGQRLRSVFGVIAVSLKRGNIPANWPFTRVFDATTSPTIAMHDLDAALRAAGAIGQAPGAAPGVRHSAIADEQTARLVVPTTSADPADNDTVRLPSADLAEQNTVRSPSVYPGARRSVASATPVSADELGPPTLPTLPLAGPDLAANTPASKRPLITRRTLLSTGVVAVASALVGAGVYRWRSSQKAGPLPGPSVRWTYPIANRPTTLAMGLGSDLYVGTDDGRLIAFDRDTHLPRWAYQANTAIEQSTPVAVPDAVYVSTSDAALYRLRDDLTVATNEQRVAWRFQVNNRPFLRPAVGNGVLYVSAYFNRLYALDSQTGTIRWRSKATFNPSSPPTLVGNRLYVAAAESVYALDAATGATIWQTPGVGTVYASMPTVGGVVYVSSLARAVHALDAATGERRWTVATGDKVYSTPAIDEQQGVVYIGGSDKYLYALDAASGALHWRQVLDSSVSTPLLANGRLYASSDAGYLYALDPSSGAVIWQYAAGNGIVTPLVVEAQTLYAGTVDGYLYALGIP